MATPIKQMDPFGALNTSPKISTNGFAMAIRTYLPTIPTYLPTIPTYLLYLPTYLSTYHTYPPTYHTYLPYLPTMPTIPTISTYLTYLHTIPTYLPDILTYLTYLPNLNVYLSNNENEAVQTTLSYQSKHEIMCERFSQGHSTEVLNHGALQLKNVHNWIGPTDKSIF